MENQPLIDADLQADLTELYRAPDRHYHGLAHIQALLALAAEIRPLLVDFEAVEAAIWFHDAIYDSRAADNETKSAEFARERLAGRTSTERLAIIVAMIEATTTHALPQLGDRDALSDAAHFLDMDLAILGAEPGAFDAYELAVRREYAWVPEEAWRAGRAAVLKKFLALERIFHTGAFIARYERRARDNLARSLAALSRT